MKRETHERALRATAKVAAAAALLGGCSTSTKASDPPDPKASGEPRTATPPAPSSTATATATASATATGSATAAPRATAAPTASAVASGALKDCEAKVAAAVAAGEKKADDATKACCQQIAKDHDARNASWMGKDRYFCCSSLDWQGSMACTPWGPPMPPALSWGLA